MATRSRSKDSSSFYEKNYISIKIFTIAITIAILLLPAQIIENLITERYENHKKVIEQVSNQWSESQVVAGPIIQIPYLDENNGEEVSKTLYILPDILNIEGSVNSEIRYRANYEVLIYQSDIYFSGNFSSNPLKDLRLDINRLKFDEAQVVLGIQGLKGLSRVINFKFNDHSFPIDNKTENEDLVSSGIYTSVDIDSTFFDRLNSYSFNMSLNGSTELLFAPVGRETNAEIECDWQSPMFAGNYLPNYNQINKDGFFASWNINHLNKPFPQAWLGDSYDLEDSAFGIKLVYPLSTYLKSVRTVKYSFVYFSLVFLLFFMAEIILKKPIKPIQYLWIGLGVCLFFVLLFAIMEYTDFDIAYIIASLGIIILISMFAFTIFQKKRVSGAIFIWMSIIFGYMFFLIQLQQYTLLLGSIGLFITMVITLFLSTKINWSFITYRRRSRSKFRR